MASERPQKRPQTRQGVAARNKRNSEHQQLRELGQNLGARIDNNEKSEIWLPVYDSLRGVDMGEWLIAVHELAKTEDGSPKASKEMRQWEEHFRKTATSERSLRRNTTDAAKPPKKSGFGELVEILRVYVDSKAWEEEPPNVSIIPSNIIITTAKKTLDEALTEILEADVQWGLALMIMIIFKKRVATFSPTHDEVEWLRGLGKLGLLKRLAATTIKERLKKTLEGHLGENSCFTVWPHDKNHLLITGDWKSSQAGSTVQCSGSAVQVEGENISAETILADKVSVRGGSASDGLIIQSYDKDFVKVKTLGDEWSQLFDGAHVQTDKARVKVVTGESGSGKTTFGTHAPSVAIPETSVLYAKPHNDKVSAFGAQAELEVVAEALCRSISNLFARSDVSSMERFYGKLSDTKSLVSYVRNQKAFDIVLETWRHAASSVELLGWWEDKASTLSHLTMVLDEVVQLDLVRAIVDMGRLMVRYFLDLGLAKSIDIVLVGTGLERVESSAGTDVMKYGTDPKKFAVILLEKPDLDTISQRLSDRKHGNAEMYGVQHGTYSRVLATNSRMLFRAVLPIIQQPYHTRGLEEVSENPRDRLKEVGSSRMLMDFAVRYYLTQNSVSALMEKKSVYLDACFHYHCVSSQEAMRNTQDDINSVLRQVERKAELANLEEQLFDVGLARSDGKTSNALKLLSCFGRSNLLKTADGDSFEELLGYHVARQAQVWDECYSCLFGKLENDWPPKIHKGQKEQLETGSAEVVQGLANDNIGDASEEKLCQRLNDELEKQGSNFSITFWQATRTAQGPDVFHLKVAGASANLSIFQCKHSDSVSWPKAWESVGVGQGNGAYVFCQDGRSAYSRIGVEKLCEEIRGRTNLDVRLFERVVAISRQVKQSDLGLQLPDECKIMTRELLEPTISCLEKPKRRVPQHSVHWV